MIASNFQVRRATIDDLVALRRLWQSSQFPLEPLEKRLREFQVIETADGELLGAVALQIDGPHGRVHHESYSNSDLAGDLRPRLWERLHAMAKNHGLVRLWILNGGPAFWLEHDFEPAGTEILAKRPKSFDPDGSGEWLTLKLREETASLLSVEQEFELFRHSQKEQSQRVLRQARLLRLLAAVFTVGASLLLACAIWYLFRMRSHLGH
jgi:N-acetylglutamate synthase-like GNAT family acetyltransferase